MALQFRLPIAGDVVDPEYVARVAKIEQLAGQLDSMFRLPGTRIHFGLDPIVGAVPLLGDVVTAAVGLYLIATARSLGVSNRTTAKMSLNLLVDFLLGLVPFIGTIFDVFYRSNLRNLQLLLTDIAQSRNPTTTPG
jgi:hypothetical protein